MLKVNSARLLDLMLERKLGVKDLSRLCGVSMAAVSSLLNGKRSQASIPTVAKLADYFGVSPRELIFDKE